MEYLDSEYLVNDYFAEVTSYLLDSRKRLHVYVDSSFNKQERSYIVNMIRNTDRIIGIDFVFTNNKRIADISLRQDYDFEDRVVGSTTYTCETGWNIRVNRLQSAENKRWTIIHEFGHTLGLEHTFDDYDDDFYQTTDEFSSYGPTTDDTVMSYMIGNTYPLFWTRNDMNALRSIWG